MVKEPQDLGHLGVKHIRQASSEYVDVLDFGSGDGRYLRQGLDSAEALKLLSSHGFGAFCMVLLLVLPCLFTNFISIIYNG